MRRKLEIRNRRLKIKGWKSNIKSHKLAIGSLLLICAVCFLSSVAISGDKSTDNIEDTRATLEKWVETRRIISQEKRDLVLAKEMLNERIELVQREIESLRGKISEAEKSISDADKKRAKLVEENDKLKNTSDIFKGIVTKIEARINGLIKRLPDPVRDRVKLLSKSLPEDPNKTQLSLAQRFMNVIGILNEVNKFNYEITLTSEVLTLADGNTAEVTAIYFGLGQAYYIGANGKVAGVGRPAEDGWKWEPANDAAASIAEAVAILKNEKAANFVPLPVKIQ